MKSTRSNFKITSDKTELLLYLFPVLPIVFLLGADHWNFACEEGDDGAIWANQRRKPARYFYYYIWCSLWRNSTDDV